MFLGRREEHILIINWQSLSQIESQDCAYFAVSYSEQVLGGRGVTNTRSMLACHCSSQHPSPNLSYTLKEGSGLGKFTNMKKNKNEKLHCSSPNILMPWPRRRYRLCRGVLEPFPSHFGTGTKRSHGGKKIQLVMLPRVLSLIFPEQGGLHFYSVLGPTNYVVGCTWGMGSWWINVFSLFNPQKMVLIHLVDILSDI